MKNKPSKQQNRFKKQLKEKQKEAQAVDGRIERWEKKRRMWYNLYLFVGVGINFILYFTKPYGFDPSTSIFWGAFFGLGIPLATMFTLAFVHRKLIGL